jgi:hypothetical protein
VRDFSGNGRHGRHTLTSGTDGASYLNQSVNVADPRFPVGLLTNPLSDAADVGARFAINTSSPLDLSGGRGITWSVTDTSGDKLSKVRHDAQAFCPDFGVLCAFVPEEIGGNEILLLFSESKDSGLPVQTGNFMAVRLGTAGALELRLVNTNIDGSSPIPLLITPIEGQSTVLRLSHKYNGSSGKSEIKANGTLVYDATAITIQAEMTDIGHFRLGVFGSQNLGGPKNMNGHYSEAAFWWNETAVDYTQPTSRPAVETVALNPTAIAASSPALYWRLNDPAPPTKPVLTVA